ncbi:MAG TPA: protein kinase [Gammaproteobacteria bacterium]|nr:protein kinase [Gammaproteobacteria bacterium]
MKVQESGNKILIKVAGQYYVQKQEEPLGEGAFGAVYQMVACRYNRLTKKISDLDESKSLALKVAKIQSSDAKIEELVAAQQENTLLMKNLRMKGTHEVIIYRNHIFSVMPFLGKQRLKDALEGHMSSHIGAMSLASRYEVMAELSDQLIELHNRTSEVDDAYVHLDIKPANIMMKRLGLGEKSAVMVDFGLAEKLSNKKRVAGTLSYIAPETYEKGIISDKSDIYSMGLIFSEIAGDSLSAMRREQALHKLEEKRITSSGRLAHEMKKKQLIIQETPLYSDSRSYARHLALPKGLSSRERTVFNALLLEDTLKKFLNRMVNKDPKIRPSAINIAKFFRTFQSFFTMYEIIKQEPSTIQEIVAARGVNVDHYMKAPNNIKVEMLRKALLANNAKVIDLIQMDYRLIFPKRFSFGKVSRKKILNLQQSKLKQIVYNEDVMLELAKQEVDYITENIRSEVTAVAKDRGGKSLSEAKQCQLYCEHLKEECSLNILHARTMALGAQHPLTFGAKNYSHNRKMLLDKAVLLGKYRKCKLSVLMRDSVQNQPIRKSTQNKVKGAKQRRSSNKIVVATQKNNTLNKS